MAETAEIPFRCSWLVGNRRAHGYLVLGEDLHLVCLLDDSETAGVAGQAAARQFGLIGALVGAGVGAARDGLRAGKLREAYQAHAMFTTGERVAQHPMSRTVRRSEVLELKKGPHLTPILETTTGPVQVQAESPGVHEAIEVWAAEGQVRVVVVQPKTMSRGLKFGLIGAPLALVALYLLVCIPFAVRHASVESKAISDFVAFKQIATAAQAELKGPFGKPLAEACADVLGRARVEEEMGLVGKLPPAAALLITKDYSQFPRYTQIVPPYSKYGDARIESNALESRWERQASFGQSYRMMLSNPFDWADRSGRASGLPEMNKVRLLLVGRVESVDVGDRNGHARVAVRVLDYPNGGVRCEGDLDVGFGGSSSGSVGLDFMMAQGLPLGLHLLSCGATTTGVCKDVHYYSSLVAVAPPVAVAPVAAPARPAKKTNRRH